MLRRMARCEWAIEQERIRREVLDEKMAGAGSSAAGDGSAAAGLRRGDQSAAGTIATAPPNEAAALAHQNYASLRGANPESGVCIIS